jgi:hypothetical protein
LNNKQTIYLPPAAAAAVVLVLLPLAEVLHLGAVAETLEGGVAGSVVQYTPLQDVFQFVPAVAHELYPEHDPVLFLQVVVLPLQLQTTNKQIQLNTQCLHGNLFTAANF